MENFTKYYSYNQLIEDHDVLIMSQEQYLANKDNLDNPQQIVLVNRAGGHKDPKIPKWFESYAGKTDERLKKLEELPKLFESYVEKTDKRLKKLEELPKLFESYKEQTDTRFARIEDWLDKIEAKLDDSKAPKWFTTYMEEFAKKNNLKL